MFKSKSKTNSPNLGITELTLEDIKNNLRKSVSNNHLSLSNLQEFVNKATTTKGKSGFITIARPDSSRKLRNSHRIKNSDLKHSSHSPRTKDKNIFSSPMFFSTQSPSKMMFKNSSVLALKPIEESSLKNQIKFNQAKPKKLRKVVKANKKNLLETKSKIKISSKDLKSTRERALSPYENAVKDILPLLQNTKRNLYFNKCVKQKKQQKGHKK